jgi:hypothetical protein
MVIPDSPIILYPKARIGAFPNGGDYFDPLGNVSVAQPSMVYNSVTRVYESPDNPYDGATTDTRFQYVQPDNTISNVVSEKPTFFNLGHPHDTGNTITAPNAGGLFLASTGKRAYLQLVVSVGNAADHIRTSFLQVLGAQMGGTPPFMVWDTEFTLPKRFTNKAQAVRGKNWAQGNYRSFSEICLDKQVLHSSKLWLVNEGWSLVIVHAYGIVFK